MPLEGLGATANVIYQMTEQDVLQNNENMLEFAADVLEKELSL